MGLETQSRLGHRGKVAPQAKECDSQSLKSDSSQSLNTSLSGDTNPVSPRSSTQESKETIVHGTAGALISNALRKRRALREKELASADPAQIIRNEIQNAIDESLARHRNRGLDPRAAFLCVEFEGKKMLRNAHVTQDRDDEAIDHNKRMARRENIFSLAGVLCLAFPILLIFDALTFLLPRNYRMVLSNGAQDESMFGRVAL